MSDVSSVNSRTGNSNTSVLLQGLGQLVALELLFVTGGESRPEAGEVPDVTVQHLVQFEPQNPHTTEEKKLVIRNSTYVAAVTRVVL